MKIKRVEIPIPIPALKKVNSYILEDDDEVILIDLGMHVPQSTNMLEESLIEDGYDPLNISYTIVTHLHIDHIGGAGYFQRKYGWKLAIHKGEAEMIDYVTKDVDEKANYFESLLISYGIPKIDAREITHLMPGFSYRDVYHGIEYDIFLKDNDELSVGKTTLKVVETPGHSPHHICLYDARNKILFSGDHILPDITPNIRFPFEEEDSLGEYLDSLDKIKKLDIRRYYPAHGPVMSNIKSRIRELKCHHLERLWDILNVISDRDMDLYNIARNLSWDVKLPWDEFPAVQKYFAIGEALAHLNYLEKRNAVERKRIENKIYYHVGTRYKSLMDEIEGALCEYQG